MERLLIKNHTTYNKASEILRNFDNEDLDFTTITSVDDKQTLITSSNLVIDQLTDKLIDSGIYQDSWKWL